MADINFPFLSEAMLMNSLDSDIEIVPIFSNDEEGEPSEIEIQKTLPILPLKNAILFPGNVMPITVGRKKSMQLVREFNKTTKLIATATQKNPNEENPQMADLYEIGTVAQIARILEMPDGSLTVILQGVTRVNLVEQLANEPFLLCKVEERVDIKPEINEEYEVLLSSIKDMALQIIQLSSNMPKEASFAIKNINSPAFLVSFIASNSDISVENKIELLSTDNLQERARLLVKHLAEQVQLLEIKNNILSKTRKELDQQQRDYFLHQQMKQIQHELGEKSHEQEINEMREKAQSKKWSETVAAHFNKELDKLARMHSRESEYTVMLNYLQTMLELPWDEYSEDNFDLHHAREILDADHFGLEEVKERIIEHLAVLKLKGDFKSPIICLYGPPGVGKTSLGKSIARALNRKYCRISLGGLHDEAEIRGHRKTYIGAMPGRIIQNLKKVQTSNPVFVLDEIDKVGKDFRGDPEAALLEVLDPEQNNTFYDNYLELDYDLSKVLFIATANDIATISPALRDRMEMINVASYIIEEKLEIAKRHLIPQQIENHGFTTADVQLSPETIQEIIVHYTKEAGVRGLDKKIARIMRFYAKKIAMNQQYNTQVSIDDVHTILGPPKFTVDEYETNDITGVVTGLAWTAVGGDILFIETSLSKGKGVLTLTGNLGNVMKESATLALEFVKAHAEEFAIDSEMFDTHNVHIHVPEGAIPKDGPSAGITMVTSIVSAFTKRKVKNRLAMTGEITLRGKVLPVGGIKEKIIAAKRAGIQHVILCEHNRKDVEAIEKQYIDGVEFRYVNTIAEVVENALLKE
ncbi:MAG: endopeptidase La [Bacteroidales bacterium]|jgi:ATP-dependent Lon protease|nr:endopeptidase La [Bacteroidales bacterium]